LRIHQAACWSHDGRVLVFAVANEPALYSLQFQDVGKHLKQKIDTDNNNNNIN